MGGEGSDGGGRQKGLNTGVVHSHPASHALAVSHLKALTAKP